MVGLSLTHRHTNRQTDEEVIIAVLIRLSNDAITDGESSHLQLEGPGQDEKEE